MAAPRLLFFSLLLAAASLGVGCQGAALKPEDYAKAIQSAGEKDTSTGAQMLCGVIGQLVAEANLHRTKADSLREFEGLLNDCQDMVAKMKSPEAGLHFAKALAGLPPLGTVVVAEGLKGHPAHPALASEAVKGLKSARDFQAQAALMDLLGAQRVVEGVDPILAHLKSAKLVNLQIAACRALAQIPSKGGLPQLIECLKQWKKGRNRHEAVTALQALTGQSFLADASTWSGWWAQNQATFQPVPVPAPKFNAELEAKQEKGAEDVSYYELPILENRVIFVVDTSGSMTFGGSPNRLQRVVGELKALIGRLNEQTFFNIVLFNNKVKRWQEYYALVPANEASKKSAQAFLDQAEALGGTFAMDALEEALYNMALVNGVETIFFLTDGCPQPMRHSGVRSMNEMPKGIGDIRRRVRFINQTLKVRIHTIGVYTRAAGNPNEPGLEHMKGFLQGLAAENDGVYKEVN